MSSAAPSSGSPLVVIGRYAFRYRDALLPVALVGLAALRHHVDHALGAQDHSTRRRELVGEPARVDEFEGDDRRRGARLDELDKLRDVFLTGDPDLCEVDTTEAVLLGLLFDLNDLHLA